MEDVRNVFKVELVRGRIKEFEKRILSEGMCASFLPASFIAYGETERVNYDCSGYCPLAMIELSSNREMIDLLEKCLFSLMDSGGHLLDPKRLNLNTGTVFYSSDRREVRFAFVPREVASENMLHVVKELFADIERIISDEEMHSYLKSVISYIDYNNSSIFDIINYLGELRHEIHSCGY